jgi:hypothetical protein
MPRFVIDLGDIEMSKADELALSGDLQKTALSYVAGIRFQEPFVVQFPWEWLGFILRRDIDALRVGEKEIAAGLGKVGY